MPLANQIVVFRMTSLKEIALISYIMNRHTVTQRTIYLQCLFLFFKDRILLKYLPTRYVLQPDQIGERIPELRWNFVVYATYSRTASHGCPGLTNRNFTRKL